eukprot:1216370-Amphidinium_carterae.1
MFFETLGLGRVGGGSSVAEKWLCTPFALTLPESAPLSSLFHRTAGGSSPAAVGGLSVPTMYAT